MLILPRYIKCEARALKNGYVFTLCKMESPRAKCESKYCRGSYFIGGARHEEKRSYAARTTAAQLVVGAVKGVG